MIVDRDDEFWALMETIELPEDMERCVRFDVHDFVKDLPIILVAAVVLTVLILLM